ncbi:MAG: histidinol dehydrogenase [Clostridia bacterium]|nr:histidinol dehydrogenase [Clostridia bacterium]
MEIIKSSKEHSQEITANIKDKVSHILNDVKVRGDKALIEYNILFDQNQRKMLRIERQEIEEAYALVDPHLVESIKFAQKNIEVFATIQKSALVEIKSFEINPGVFLGHRIIPVDSCCCYVPGGSYPLFSTALMLAIPAKVAGVRRVVACSPTIKGTNQIHPLTLISMDIAGVDEIYAVGGAHAIAAFAYGSEQIKKVDMIVGPGNQYVAEAKRQCYGQVGIDFVAGPSEVLIIADETARPEIIAADLLAQSEHDILAKAVLITTDKHIANETIQYLEMQLKNLPTADIAKRSWEDFGEIILAESLEEAVDISNVYAPEHLEIVIKDSDLIVSKLVNYGSLFIGQYAAEVFGDYASGTNHTLPTAKAARYTGGVWTGTFLKVCTHQCMTIGALKTLSPIVSSLARAEGLLAHAHAAEIRIEL